ncbi:MAG: hypothetical protein R3E91_02850 [Chlamydiales bacterium]
MTLIHTNMQTKIFIGIRLTLNLKFQLGDIPPIFSSYLYEEKEYLGIYLNSQPLTLHQIRECRDLFLINLQEYYPDHRFDHIPILLFPQLFIG